MDNTVQEVVATNIADPIDTEILNKFLSAPPFVDISGSFNSRDLNDGSGNSSIRASYAYRCGSLEQLTEEGKKAIVRLGIKTIFDLRSLKERQEFPDPEIEGVENKWKPSTLDNNTTTQKQKPGNTKFTFTKMYVEMLQTHKASFKVVFEHIRDHPDRPFLFHCTAGKDRTGLTAFLILSMTGTPLAYINHDYALTRLGTEHVRDLLITKLTGGLNMDLRSPTMQAYANVPLDAWTPVLEVIESEYGGVEAYVISELGFSNEDLERIKENLRS